MVSCAGHYVNMKTSILVLLVVVLCFDYSYSEEEQSNALGSGSSPPPDIAAPTGPFPCVCGVFLSGQFTKGSSEQPRGHAALLHEHQETFACNVFGNKQCTNKCLDVIVKHLPNSPSILCGSIDRDCHKERAYLFIKNCNDTWINTNLSAGREYCCKDGLPYKCPLI